MKQRIFLIIECFFYLLTYVCWLSLFAIFAFIKLNPSQAHKHVHLFLFAVVAAWTTTLPAWTFAMMRLEARPPWLIRRPLLPFFWYKIL